MSADGANIKQVVAAATNARRVKPQRTVVHTPRPYQLELLEHAKQKNVRLPPSNGMCALVGLQSRARTLVAA
jgi:hypothetical protein